MWSGAVSLHHDHTLNPTWALCLKNPKGTKYWRMKYRIKGKEKLRSYGRFPEVTFEHQFGIMY